MMKTGMTSVTFRNKSAEEIVCLTHKAGLTGIEWGGDVHVPAGDRAAARKAALLTREAGLEVLSYGSYFRAGEEEDFSPILESAIELGAPMIRIWAGTKSYEDSSPEEFAALAGRIREAGKLAAAAGIQLGMEYHRGTATQTKEGAEALIKAINLPEVGCYWQPNPDISHSEQLAEIDLLLPFLQNIHVFCWTGNNERHFLSDGVSRWKDYLTHIQKSTGRHDLILEFVKDDSDEAFLFDAETLKKLAAETAGLKGENV